MVCQSCSASAGLSATPHGKSGCRQFARGFATSEAVLGCNIANARAERQKVLREVAEIGPELVGLNANDLRRRLEQVDSRGLCSIIHLLGQVGTQSRLPAITLRAQDILGS
jgi:hypothetical protein